jgi:hypothetical protein
MLYCRVIRSHFAYYLLCFYIHLNLIDVGIEVAGNNRIVSRITSCTSIFEMALCLSLSPCVAHQLSPSSSCCWDPRVLYPTNQGGAPRYGSRPTLIFGKKNYIRTCFLNKLSGHTSKTNFVWESYACFNEHCVKLILNQKDGLYWSSRNPLFLFAIYNSQSNKTRH